MEHVGCGQLFLSAGERQSRELMMKAAGHLRKLKRAFDQAERSEVFEGVTFTALELRIKDGIRIIGLPADPSTARVFTGDCLLDEFSRHGGKDAAIYAAAYGSVTRESGELDVCSTPKGRMNMFYRLAENPVFAHSVVTIEDAVADGLDVNIAELRAGLYYEELWRQEYLCEFVDEASSFLTYELIGKCEDPKLARDLDFPALADLAHDQADVYVGMDVGPERHPSVIWLFDRVGSRLIHRGIIEMIGIPFRQQYERLTAILRCPAVKRCCIDKGGLGMQLAENAQQDFGSKVEPIQFTLAMKEQLAGDLLIKVEDGNLRIPVCDKIRNDLHSVQRRVTAAGHVRYQAPAGGDEHADRFWALSLAVHAAAEQPVKVEGILGPKLRTWGMKNF